jgi:3-methyladenine DNA glycosylase/8-oxoguanine DNA glycosylase
LQEELRLPEPYDLGRTLGRLGERLGDVTQNLAADVWLKARRLPFPHVLRYRFLPGRIVVEAPPGAPLDGRAEAVLGLTAPWSAFAATATSDPVLSRLLAYAPGMRAFCYDDLFEAIVMTVFGQQVHLALARRHRAEFVWRFGTPVTDNLYAFPQPAAVLSRARELSELRLTRQKVTSILAVAEAFRDGALTADSTIADLEALRLPGLGPWTLAWVGLHGFGDLDQDLLTDLGVRRAIAAGHGLGREDSQALAAVTGRHAPFRAWAALYYLLGWAEGVLPRASSSRGKDL